MTFFVSRSSIFFVFLIILSLNLNCNRSNDTNDPVVSSKRIINKWGNSAYSPAEQGSWEAARRYYSLIHFFSAFGYERCDQFHNSSDLSSCQKPLKNQIREIIYSLNETNKPVLKSTVQSSLNRYSIRKDLYLDTSVDFFETLVVLDYTNNSTDFLRNTRNLLSLVVDHDSSCKFRLNIRLLFTEHQNDYYTSSLGQGYWTKQIISGIDIYGQKRKINNLQSFNDSGKQLTTDNDSINWAKVFCE